MDIAVKLDTSPRLPREMKKYEDPNFEFRVRDIAAADRVSARLPADSQACSSTPFAKAAGRRSATSPTGTCC